MTTTTTKAAFDPGTFTPGNRIFNFSAGPATLPEEVLRQAQQDIWNIDDSGIGILEHSHRGKVFDRVIEQTEADCRKVADISDDYAVLFLQGGATTQFDMIPMNFLDANSTADYPDTGSWTKKAIKEAKLFGKVNVAFDGSQYNYDHTPSDDELNLTPEAAYLHYCSNNTIFGTRYNTPPKTDAPLVGDMSSEIFSRTLDVNKHAMIYAGAQKNLGPAGVTLVIIRKDFMERGKENLPIMFDYRQHASKGSRLNTPPTFGIYFVGQMFRWLLDKGGLDAIEKHNDAKAKLIYDVIDELDFYSGVASPNAAQR